jgi:LPXTG-motif cell wall-anchored protein
MSNNSVTKTSSHTAWIILAILLFAGGGFYLYKKGKEDAENKVRIEQRITYLKEQLPHKQAELQLAANELGRINGFQFLGLLTKKNSN